MPRPSSLIGEDLGISAGRIFCQDAEANEQLAGAINDAAVEPNDLDRATGRAAQEIRQQARHLSDAASRADEFSAVSIPRHPGHLDTDAPYAAATATFSDVFDLTAAEARLAVAIATGKDLNSFSVERRLSKETVRNQLKSIFLKTGTNRQAQLAVMFSTLVPKK